MRRRPISRRTFLKHSLLGTAALAAGPLVPAGRNRAFAQSAGKPNILIFFTDQERPTSRYLPALALPNRQRILNRCVEFTNCYSSYPLCSPCRSSLLTGLYPHDTGITHNLNQPGDGSLPTTIPNLASEFSQAGYDVGYFGKWHLNDPGASPDLPAYGFDQFYLPSNQNSGQLSDQDIADNAASWISSRGSTPWICFVSIINPHDVYYPQHYSDIPDRPVSLPPNFDDDLSGITEPAELRTIIDAEAQGYRQWDAAEWAFRLGFYCHLIELTDNQLGVVLDAVDSIGQTNDTIVVYTSDHGEQHASHQLRGKPFLYEEASRIPLVVSWPQIHAGYNQSNLLANTVDIVPTLCDLAGIGWPTALPGRSLVDPACDPSAPVFSEAGFLEYGIPELTYMVRTVGWKYVQYHPSGHEQMFDLVNDSPEIYNLANSAAHASIKSVLQGHLNNFLGLADSSPPAAPTGLRVVAR